FGGEDAHPRHGGCQNGNGQGNLIPGDGAHGNPGEHGHGRGKGHVGRHLHNQGIHIPGSHGAHNHHKGNHTQHGDGHDRGVDVLQLVGGGAHGAEQEGIDEEPQDEEHHHVKKQRHRNVKEHGNHGRIPPVAAVQVIEHQGGAENHHQLQKPCHAGGQNLSEHHAG